MDRGAACSGSRCGRLLAAARRFTDAGRRCSQAVYFAGLELTRDHRDRGDVLGALDAGALGALHARRSTWSAQWSYDLRELRREFPPPLSTMHRGWPRTWRPTCRSSTCARWRPKARSPGRRTSRIATRLRAALLGVRAVPRRGGVRVPGLQVSGEHPLRAGRAAHWRVALVALALVLGAACYALARFATGSASARHGRSRNFRTTPPGEHLRPATLGFSRGRGRPRVAARGPVLRRAPLHATTASCAWSTCSTSSPRSRPAFCPPTSSASFALAQEGGDFPAAERLMLKGLAANPRSGALAFQPGFLYYVRPGGRDLPPCRGILRAGRPPERRAARRPPASRPSPRQQTRRSRRWPTNSGSRSPRPVAEPLSEGNGGARAQEHSRGSRFGTDGSRDPAAAHAARHHAVAGVQPERENRIAPERPAGPEVRAQGKRQRPPKFTLKSARWRADGGDGRPQQRPEPRLSVKPQPPSGRRGPAKRDGASRSAIQGVRHALREEAVPRGAGHRQPHDQGGRARAPSSKGLPPRQLGHLRAARRSDRRRRDHGPPARDRRDLEPARIARHQVAQRGRRRQRPRRHREEDHDEQALRRGRAAGDLLGSRAARALRHQRRVARLRDPRAGARTIPSRCRCCWSRPRRTW